MTATGITYADPSEVDWDDDSGRRRKTLRTHQDEWGVGFGDRTLDWQNEALCVEHRDLFCQTIDGGYDRWHVEQRAKKICWNCPVVDECFAWALDQPETKFANLGVVGGRNFQQRSAARQKLISELVFS